MLVASYVNQNKNLPIPIRTREIFVNTRNRSSAFPEFLVLSFHLASIAHDRPHYIINMQAHPRTTAIIDHSYANIVRIIMYMNCISLFPFDSHATRWTIRKVTIAPMPDKFTTHLDGDVFALSSFLLRQDKRFFNSAVHDI